MTLAPSQSAKPAADPEHEMMQRFLNQIFKKEGTTVAMHTHPKTAVSRRHVINVHDVLRALFNGLFVAGSDLVLGLFIRDELPLPWSQIKFLVMVILVADINLLFKYFS